MTTERFEMPNPTAKSRKRTNNKKQTASPSREQIARLAEKYWAERGRPEGSPDEDWLRAERELMGKAS